MKYLILILIVFSVTFPQNTVGLLTYDSAKSYDGYTLFAPNTTTTTYLIDINGNLVHTWESDYTARLSAYLLEDGSLLRSAAIVDTENVGSRRGGFQLFDWEGNVIWEYYSENQHHDIEPLSNGNVLLIVNDEKTNAEAIEAGRDPTTLSNNLNSVAIIEVRQIGIDSTEIVWQWNAWDHLIQDHDNTKNNFGIVADHPELIDLNIYTQSGQDWLHTNSVAYNEELDQIIISNRNINEIWIIDHSTTTAEAASHVGGNSGKGGDLLYRWGNPVTYDVGNLSDQKLYGQHDAHWVEPGIPGGGNILVFNNGFPNRGYSTVDEVVLPTIDQNGNYSLVMGSAYGPTNPTWFYSATEPEDFNSPRYGGSQRLPNGNTLVCNSDSGEFFELNPEDEIVWRYINPVTKDGILEQGTTEINNNQVFRCYRYGESYSAFLGKDLTPGNPIELYNVSVDDENSSTLQFKLDQNYPNPFNPSTTINFSLSQKSNVTIKIYDMLGSEIKTLLNNYLESGLNSVTWNGLDSNGNPVSSGVYLYKITADYESHTKKMILLR